MKKITFALIILATMFIAACSSASSGPGPADNLAQCLTEKNVIMYGTEWCPHCKNQKEQFGNSFQHVTYVDCDRNRAACNDAAVRGYPTWVIDGASYAGVQPLYTLAENSGCTEAYIQDTDAAKAAA